MTKLKNQSELTQMPYVGGVNGGGEEGEGILDEFGSVSAR
jgi:hypothetical protein